MRAVRRILVVLVIVAVLAVVADRGGVWAAERTVADQVAAELASYEVDSAPPDVQIEGVPFLTQVGAGRYEQVTLVLREVGTGEVRLSQVELVATGVTAAVSTLVSGEGPIDAERVDGTALISYAELIALSGVEGLELSAGSSGAMAIRWPTELAGQPVTLVGVAEASVAGEAIRLEVSEVTVEDPDGRPPGVEDLVNELFLQLSMMVPLPPLPYGLSVDSVRAEPAGLAVEVSATDVPLAR